MLKNNERKKRWLYVGLWFTLIYSTLYIVRPVCNFLKAHTPFDLIISLSLSMLIAGIICITCIKFRVRRISSFILIIFSLGLYASVFIWLKIPEEKVHLLEYGFLSFLIYYAIKLDKPELPSYFGAAIIALLLGWGDEGIQHILPNRYYEIKDVILNSVSSILGLILTWVLSRDRNCRITQKR